jgi:ribosomal protein L31
MCLFTVNQRIIYDKGGKINKLKKKFGVNNEANII